MPARKKKAASKKGAVKSVKLKPAKPFELIRLLAMSQHDPRKAVAELVQNALDAGATRISIERRRKRNVPILIIRDNGEGVLPQREREDALHYLATHVGHSHKLGLTPSQRAEHVVAGKYGVGLLGFWSVGRYLDICTRVNGSDLWSLQLERDKPRADIAKLPTPIGAPETFTEIIVSDIHQTALRSVSGKKLTEYLSSELRGQLLGREVDLTIEDRLQRGSGQRRFVVIPEAFVGERMALPSQVEVPGFRPAQVELYTDGSDQARGVELACLGTLVADNMMDVAALECSAELWRAPGLCGRIDFPDFNIPPGTRRNIIVDEAAASFIGALRNFEQLLGAQLEALQQARELESQKHVARDLRRALRGFEKRLPNYMLPHDEHGGLGGKDGKAGYGGSDSATEAEDFDAGINGDKALPEEETAGLSGDEASGIADGLPLLEGELARVELVPNVLRIAPGTQKRAWARCYDDAGSPLRHRLKFAWHIDVANLHVEGDGARPGVVADPTALRGTTGVLEVTVTRGGVVRKAAADVIVSDEEELGAGDLGIPEPQWITEPQRDWRSRMVGDTWQVNDGHPDYRSVRTNGAARLRYLIALVAKELVYRSHGQPGDDVLLERVVEIMAHAERNMAEGKGKGKSKRKSKSDGESKSKRLAKG